MIGIQESNNAPLENVDFELVREESQRNHDFRKESG